MRRRTRIRHGMRPSPHGGGRGGATSPRHAVRMGGGAQAGRAAGWTAERERVRQRVRTGCFGPTGRWRGLGALGDGGSGIAAAGARRQQAGTCNTVRFDGGPAPAALRPSTADLRPQHRPLFASKYRGWEHDDNAHRTNPQVNTVTFFKVRDTPGPNLKKHDVSGSQPHYFAAKQSAASNPSHSNPPQPNSPQRAARAHRQTRAHPHTSIQKQRHEEHRGEHREEPKADPPPMRDHHPIHQVAGQLASSAAPLHERGDLERPRVPNAW